MVIGNGDFAPPKIFVDVIESTGLKDMVYTPPKIPMGRDDWPVLSSMILSGKRAVIFMDYQANQTETPWLMDEFAQIWETPFSPTDPAFPCTVQRPPGLPPQEAKKKMYTANHNLNLEFNFGSLNMLIPNSAQIDQTNAVDGPGSLGVMARNCTGKLPSSLLPFFLFFLLLLNSQLTGYPNLGMWGNPPNFLLVDYYNYGNVNGSVFQVAAEMNNVTYNGLCCGSTSAAPAILQGQNMMSMLLVLAGVQLFSRLF